MLNGDVGGGFLQLSNEKNPGWLGYIGDEILPSYIGTIISLLQLFI